MILGTIAEIADRAELGQYIRLINRGCGGHTPLDLPGTYNGEVYYGRRNTGSNSYQIYNWSTNTLIATLSGVVLCVSMTVIVSQYMYVGYGLTADYKFRIAKIDLTNGTTTTIFTDTAISTSTRSITGAYNVTEGKIVFHSSGAGRRVIVTIDPSDDSTTTVFTGATPLYASVSCSSAKIYYNTNLSWYSMDWDGTNTTLSHTIPSSFSGVTGPDGIHNGNGTYLYDANGTNAWNLGKLIHGGIFLTSSAPYYLVGWDTSDDIFVWKLAAVSSTTLLETISTNHAYGSDLLYPSYMRFASYNPALNDVQIMLGLSKAFEIVLPTKEHN